MNTISVERVQELKDALFRLLEHIDKLETSTGIDLLVLRVDVETIIGRFDRIDQVSSSLGAVQTFDRLITLDSAFRTLEKRWTDIRRRTGLEAAEEILAASDLYARWSRKWALATEQAWAMRKRWEARSERAELRTGTNMDLASLVIMLDLRYAADLPMTRIGEMINISSSAVQARVAQFEAQVAEAIAVSAIQSAVPAGWRMMPQSRDAGILLEDDCGGTVSIEIVHTRQDRDGSGGRPREAAAMLNRLARGVRIWAVVFVDGPKILYMPQRRLMAYARGTQMARVPMERIIRLAPELGYDDLGEAVKEALAGDEESEAAHG